MDTCIEQQRLADGLPLPGGKAVALDVVAYLARVNFGNTERVLQALIALHQATGIPYNDIMQLSAMPTCVPDSDARLDATEQLVRQIAHSKLVAPVIRKALNLVQRFN